MSNLYETYCNDIQNEAWGAYHLALFIQSYNRNSSTKALLIHLFTIMPFIVNDDLKKLVVNENYRNKIKNSTSLIRNILNSSSKIGTIQNYIAQYKEYTLVSFIFAIKLGLISIDEDTTELYVCHELPNLSGWSSMVSDRLGYLFSRIDLPSFYNYIGVYV